MRNVFPPLITVGNKFPVVIIVGNTFPLVITVENTFSLVIAVRNRFPLVITVETTFPQLITVGKNNGSSFFLRKRGTSEMSSMGHRNNAKINVSQNILVPFCSSKLVHFFNFFSEEFSFPISFENANFSE